METNKKAILKRVFDPQKARKSYRNVAWFYDFWSWLTESKAAKKVIELAEIQDKQAILEVACGTGNVLKKIVEKNPHGKNTGLDLSGDMLNKARSKMQKPDGQNVELIEGNALQLDFADNTFDRLINNFMIDLMPEETFDRIATEFYRILKPGGVAVISVFSFGKKRIHRFWYWVARKMPGLLTGCRPVSFGEHLIKAGFTIEQHLEISQNTFPSAVFKARKLN